MGQVERVGAYADEPSLPVEVSSAIRSIPGFHRLLITAFLLVGSASLFYIGYALSSLTANWPKKLIILLILEPLGMLLLLSFVAVVAPSLVPQRYYERLVLFGLVLSALVAIPMVLSVIVGVGIVIWLVIRLLLIG